MNPTICTIRKRVKDNQFGDNSENEVKDEGEDDAEGKKRGNKRIKRDIISNADSDFAYADNGINDTTAGFTFIKETSDEKYAANDIFNGFNSDQATTNETENSTDDSIHTTPNFATDVNELYRFRN